MKKALHFAQKIHKNQKRKCGRPFIIHPVSVMQQLMDLGFKGNVLKAALLHDVYEDGDVTFHEIEKKFGKEVRFLVYSLSKEPKSNFTGIEAAYIKRLKAYFLRLKAGIKKCPILLFIKICDNLDNIRSISLFPEQKYYQLLWEIKYYYIPFYDEYSLLLNKKQNNVFMHLFEELKSTADRLLSSQYYKTKKRQKKMIIKHFFSDRAYQYLRDLSVFSIPNS